MKVVYTFFLFSFLLFKINDLKNLLFKKPNKCKIYKFTCKLVSLMFVLLSQRIYQHNEPYNRHCLHINLLFTLFL